MEEIACDELGLFIFIHDEMIFQDSPELCSNEDQKSPRFELSSKLKADGVLELLDAICCTPQSFELNENPGGESPTT